MDLVTAQGGVAAGLDLNARAGVAGDVVVLQRAQPVVIDADAACLAVVDLVAASRGSAPFLIATQARLWLLMSQPSRSSRP